jgi:hypothetical protein
VADDAVYTSSMFKSADAVFTCSELEVHVLLVIKAQLAKNFNVILQVSIMRDAFFNQRVQHDIVQLARQSSP